MAAVSSVTWQILLQWRHVKTLYNEGGGEIAVPYAYLGKFGKRKTEQLKK